MRNTRISRSPTTRTITAPATRRWCNPLDNPLKSPPSYGYPPLPPNWESAARISTKPTTQEFYRTFQGTAWGAVSDDPFQQRFTIAPYPNPAQLPVLAKLGIGTAPFGYWQRGMDCYTQAISIVDTHIGTVLDALPEDVARNTVVIFTADHGEYNGAHGFIAGKFGSAYDEAFHLPLIVSDPTGQFTADTQTIRTGMTSSVDMLGLLVSLAYGGSRDWITPALADPYASRHDLIPMLKSASAPGRDYVLLVSDELWPGFYVYNDLPAHVLGVRTTTGKLGVYANWTVTGNIDPASVQTEYYDYSTARGRLELDSTPNSPAAQALKSQLFTTIIPNELRAPIGTGLQTAQLSAKAAYLVYETVISGLAGPTPGFGEDS